MTALYFFWAQLRRCSLPWGSVSFWIWQAREKFPGWKWTSEPSSTWRGGEKGRGQRTTRLPRGCLSQFWIKMFYIWSQNFKAEKLKNKTKQKQFKQQDNNQVILGSTRQFLVKIRNHKAKINHNNLFFPKVIPCLWTPLNPRPPSQLLFKIFHKYPSCIYTTRVYIAVCITVPHHNGYIGFKITTGGTQNEQKYKKQWGRGPVGNKRLHNWRHMLTLKQ